MVKYLILFGVFARLAEAITNRPIIGIVSQELFEPFKSHYPFYDSHIVASYVKAVESSGARVVPIQIGQSIEYYRNIIHSVNGLLFPGGPVSFNGTDNYYSAGKVLYEKSLELNKKINFPILGVCLGFEMLVHLSNEEKEIRKICNVKDVLLPLKFLHRFKNSSIFKNIPARIIHTLKKNTSANWHVWCLYPEVFQKQNLKKQWKVLATSPDFKGEEFVSAVEHVDYPIVGVQFHPEKESFEWSPEANYAHTRLSIEASRHFYDWLVTQARLNAQSFKNKDVESQSLIFNFNPIYSESMFPYTQMYLFKSKWMHEKNYLNQ